MRRRAASLVAANGQAFVIDERLEVGRGRDADVVVPSGIVTRRHVVLVRLPSDELEAEDFSTNGTRLNGVALRHALLKHGDELELGGFVYRLELGVEVEAPPEPAAALLAKAGDDEAAIQVVIDMLLEQGDPLGAALAAGERPPLPRVLVDAVELGTVELEWRHGFVRSARIRAQAFHAVRDQLTALLRSEAGRFLDALTLPERSPRFALERTPLPALRTLRFGPFFTEAGAARCRAALGPLPLAPFLRAPEVLRYSKAWLEFDGGQRRELDPGRQESFATCAVRWEPDGWLVSRTQQNPTLFVNGISRFTAGLLPDDVVSSGALRFVFRAS